MGNKLIALLFIVGILLFIGTPATSADLDKKLNPSWGTQNGIPCSIKNNAPKAIGG